RASRRARSWRVSGRRTDGGRTLHQQRAKFAVYSRAPGFDGAGIEPRGCARLPMNSGPRLARKQFDPGATGPLDGVRVIDLSRLVAGNMLTKALADFGAEVVKVEPPEGDTLRAWRVEGISTAWKTWCMNKKSVCLDLRTPEGREVVRRLARGAAMLIESFR